MKCDELKVIKIILNNHGKPMASIQGTTCYYGISPYATFCPQDEVDDAIAELKAKLAEKDKEIARQNEAWNRLCKKYNKFVSLKQEFCEKFKDIELEITK